METRWEAGRCGCRCPWPSGVCSRAGCLDFIPSTSHTGLLPRCTWDVLGNVFFLAFSHQTLGTRFTIQIVCSCTAEKILHLSLMCLLLMMKTWVFKRQPLAGQTRPRRKKTRPGELSISPARWRMGWPDVTNAEGRSSSAHTWNIF